jgi:hypothetical protein
MSSAVEAELGALFINPKTAILMQQMLAELSHPQPCTPMQTNNATAHALITKKYYQKHSMPWICVSTGYDAATHRANYATIGDLAHTAWQITSPSITQPATTNLLSPQY